MEAALGGGVSTPNWITTYSAWPPPETQMQPFYLTGDAALTTSKPTSAEQTAPRTYTYPTGTELIGTNAQFSVPVEPEGVLVYRSAPMTEDLTILGAPQITFYVSIQHDDADFVVDLHDLYPNGDVQYLQRGLLRASMRAIDSKRSRPDAIRHRFDKSEPLVPGKVYEIKMSLPPVGAVDPPGAPPGGDHPGAVADRATGLGFPARGPAGTEHRLSLGDAAVGAQHSRHPRRAGAGTGAGVRVARFSALPPGQHDRSADVHREAEDRAVGGKT